MKSNRTAPLGYLTSKEFAALHNPKWGVVFKDLNNPDGLFTTGPARARVYPLNLGPTFLHEWIA
jgi:hypothetical protein